MNAERNSQIVLTYWMPQTTYMHLQRGGEAEVPPLNWSFFQHDNLQAHFGDSVNLFLSPQRGIIWDFKSPNFATVIWPRIAGEDREK